MLCLDIKVVISGPRKGKDNMRPNISGYPLHRIFFVMRTWSVPITGKVITIPIQERKSDTIWIGSVISLHEGPDGLSSSAGSKVQRLSGQ